MPTDLEIPGGRCDDEDHHPPGGAPIWSVDVLRKRAEQPMTLGNMRKLGVRQLGT
jgi:hypothetical protein